MLTTLPKTLVKTPGTARLPNELCREANHFSSSIPVWIWLCLRLFRFRLTTISNQLLTIFFLVMPNHNGWAHPLHWKRIPTSCPLCVSIVSSCLWRPRATRGNGELLPCDRGAGEGVRHGSAETQTPLHKQEGCTSAKSQVTGLADIYRAPLG